MLAHTRYTTLCIFLATLLVSTAVAAVVPETVSIFGPICLHAPCTPPSELSVNSKTHSKSDTSYAESFTTLESSLPARSIPASSSSIHPKESINSDSLWTRFWNGNADYRRTLIPRFWNGNADYRRSTTNNNKTRMRTHRVFSSRFWDRSLVAKALNEISSLDVVVAKNTSADEARTNTAFTSCQTFSRPSSFIEDFLAKLWSSLDALGVTWRDTDSVSTI